MLNVKYFINFEDYDEFELINENKSTVILTSQKTFSPSQKYIFKKFQFECYSSKDQKTILDTFSNIRIKKCQFLLSYRYLSLLFKSNYKPTFAMKYKSSKTLEQVLKNPDLFIKFKTENILHCLFAVAEGLSYLHTNLICHGNLCPSNIIIDDANQFYLCDFGLYPIKKLYVKEDYLFNKDYKDPYMKNNNPSFSTDIYSYGVLMCDIFMVYLKSINKIEKNETLRSFLRNFSHTKFDLLPSFYSKLISSCLNSFSSERPSFSQITKMFKNEKQQFFGIDVQKLYNDFINSNYLLNLAEKDDSNTLNKIGRMYEKGKIFEKNTQKALEFYEKAAILNNSEAQNNYGVLLQEKEGRNKLDLIKGANYLRLSADQGDIYGMANYAIALLNGDGVDQNVQKAREYLQKSADLGYSYAQLYYGNLLLDNNPSISTINKGLLYIKKAMNQSNSDAFLTFSNLLQEGKFIEKNEDSAMEYLKNAADLGNEEAIIEYAQKNLKASPSNEKVALKYYQIAFDNGNKSVKNIIDRLKEKIEGPKNIEPNVSLHTPKDSIKSSPNRIMSASKKSNNNNYEPSLKEKDISLKKSSLRQSHETSKIRDQYVYADDELSNDELSYDDDVYSKKVYNKTKSKPMKYNDIMEKLRKNIPVRVSKVINLISLGKIVYDRSSYHSSLYIYPVGYQIEREFTSISDHTKTTLYKCTIIDGGESPIFKVECLDESKMVFKGNTPSSPWNQVIVAIEKSKNELDYHRKKNYISGPIYFGLTNEIISYLIKRLPNAEKCSDKFSRYIRKVRSDNMNYPKELNKDEIEEEEEEEAIEENEEKEEEENHGQSLHVKNKSISEDQVIDSIDPNLNENIDSKQQLEEIIKQGDLFYEKNDLVNTFKCYKKAISNGRKDVLLKCAEACHIFDEKLKYLEQALKENVPKSFSKWRLAIMKRIYLTKNKGDYVDFAKKFELFQDFSDAAILYSKSKDIINSKICYEKAKLNIDDIKDGYQQYDFGCFLINQKDFELAEIMLQKAVENNISSAQLKLKRISQQNKEQNLTEAESLLQKGISYYEGTNGNQKNDNLALEFFEKASKLNCPKADFYIGCLKINEEGLDHIIKSAKSGDPDGQNRYAHYLKHGILLIKNNEKAMKYYKLAADNGQPEASFEYGREKYEKGSTDEERQEGIEYIKKSAESLFPDAVYMYSKIDKELKSEDSNKFFEFAIEKGSLLALKEKK